MMIEILLIEGCPHTEQAVERLRATLVGLGHPEAAIHLRYIESAADTAGTEFAGSPTFTVDGTDIFDGGKVTDDLSCRIYRTPTGLAGVPTIGQLTEALEHRGL